MVLDLSAALMVGPTLIRPAPEHRVAGRAGR